MNFLKFRASKARGAALWAATWVVGVATLLGCSRKNENPSEAGPAASPVASARAAPAPSGLVNAVPVTDDAVTAAVNPKRLPAYKGPFATVRGQITITGDPAPETPEAIEKFSEKNCKVAREVYGRLFREGLMRAAADVLVTVSGYEQYVAPTEEVVRVVGRDCAWDRLTVGVMFGQRLEVSSRGLEPYMPQIVGAPAKALMIAVPRGDPVRLYPPRPGRFTLADRVHAGMNAEVFVLKYPTFDVTGLDGRFEVKNVPPGNVTVGAILPAIGKTASKKIRVEAAKTYDVNLEIAFDAKKDAPKPRAPDVAAAGAPRPH